MAGHDLGTHLRTARRRVRLSQTAVGAELGVARQTVGAFEKGERNPSLTQFATLANLYRLTLDELVGGVRSVVHDAPPVSFLGRANAGGDLTDDDRAELRSFSAYLAQRRGKHPEFHVSSMTFETIEQLVDRWRSTGPGKMLDVVPAPVFEFLLAAGLEVRFTALDDLAGALIPGSDRHPAGVLINADQPYDRGRWTAAHEIGHIVLQHEASEGCELGRRFRPAEVQADQFAGELLMPARAIPLQAKRVEEELRGRGRLTTAHSILMLGRKFLVSYQAMLVRLGQLGALPASDVERLKKEKAAQLAKDLGLHEEQGSVRFDVAQIPQLVARMPVAWQAKADAEAVRLLQTAAWSDYIAKVPERDRADTAGTVYESVALWVAREHPIVRL